MLLSPFHGYLNLLEYYNSHSTTMCQSLFPWYYYLTMCLLCLIIIMCVLFLRYYCLMIFILFLKMWVLFLWYYFLIISVLCLIMCVLLFLWYYCLVIYVLCLIVCALFPWYYSMTIAEGVKFMKAIHNLEFYFLI